MAKSTEEVSDARAVSGRRFTFETGDLVSAGLFIAALGWVANVVFQSWAEGVLTGGVILAAAVSVVLLASCLGFDLLHARTQWLVEDNERHITKADQ